MSIVEVLLMVGLVVFFNELLKHDLKKSNKRIEELETKIEYIERYIQSGTNTKKYESPQEFYKEAIEDMERHIQSGANTKKM